MTDQHGLGHDLIDEATLAALDPEHLDRSLPALLARRVRGGFEIDQWGFDVDLATALAPLASLLRHVRVEGAEAVPEIGPALLVVRRGLAPVEPLVVAAALAGRTGRTVRVAGVPDVAVLGPLLRRLGGVPTNAHDLRSLFRSGEVVLRVNPWSPRRPGGSGDPDPGVLEAARSAGAPVLSVVVSGQLLGRERVVRVTEPREG